MKTLKKELNKIFLELGIDPILSAICISNRPDLSEYQCNGSLQAAKILKQNPLNIAKLIVDKLSPTILQDFEITVSTPGFINIKLKDHKIFELVLNNLEVDSLNQKVVIDYGSPNVAKGMHVGHLRSTLIGAALVNMYKYASCEVIGDNHIGDFGTPLGIVISQIINNNEDINNLEIDKIESVYVLGSKKFKEDEDFKTQVLEVTKKLQNQDPYIVKIWQAIIDITKKSLIEDYDQLGIHFDEWNGESAFESLIPEMIKELVSKEMATESNGSLIIELEANKQPLVLTKSNGSYLYHTTDLACLKTRMNFDKSLYVVDNRQALHFSQLFEAGIKAGYLKPNQATHISFGTINGKDNKPFKTRNGDVLKLKDLIDQVLEKSKEKIANDNITPSEQENIAKIVGIGSLKFAELKHNRNNDYIFDIDQFLSPEGFTGPYIMYAGVRANSILKKHNDDSMNPSYVPQLSEKKLLIKMSQFSDYFNKSLQSNEPHHLCEYLYDLASLFNHFYNDKNISKESNLDIQKQLVWTTKKFVKTLETGLNILGIELPSKM